MAGGSSAEWLWPELCARYGLTYPLPIRGSGRYTSPRWLKPEDQRHALTLAVEILADWPVGFAEALLSIDLWSSDRVLQARDAL